jgi:hypothetical protein
MLAKPQKAIFTNGEVNGTPGDGVAYGKIENIRA